jgi:hypothetical protein
VVPVGHDPAAPAHTTATLFGNLAGELALPIRTNTRDEAVDIPQPLHAAHAVYKYTSPLFLHSRYLDPAPGNMSLRELLRPRDTDQIDSGISEVLAPQNACF